MTVKFDGETYGPVERIQVLNGRRDAVVFRAIGMTLADCMALMEKGSPALFAVAALVWAVSDTAGGSLTFDEVLDRVNLGTEIEIEEGDAGPPAPGES